MVRLMKTEHHRKESGNDSIQGTREESSPTVLCSGGYCGKVVTLAGRHLAPSVTQGVTSGRSR